MRRNWKEMTSRISGHFCCEVVHFQFPRRYREALAKFPLLLEQIHYTFELIKTQIRNTLEPIKLQERNENNS